MSKPFNMAMVEEAFSAGRYGDHGLSARIDDVYAVDGKVPEAGLPMRWHVEVRGRFFSRHGLACGEFRRCLYLHDETREPELWLGGMEVDPKLRGGMMAFTRDSLAVCARAGVKRVRAVAGRSVGGYALARFGFKFDPVRLPGFGAGGRGVGRGGEQAVLPLAGERLAEMLCGAIADAAVATGRLSEAEAEGVSDLAPDSVAGLLDHPRNDVSRRLLAGSRWPALLELEATDA